MNWQQIWCGHHWPCTSCVLLSYALISSFFLWNLNAYACVCVCECVSVSVLCKSNFRASDFFFSKKLLRNNKNMFYASSSVCVSVYVFFFFIFEILEIAHLNWSELSVYACAVVVFFGNNQFFTSKGQFAKIHSKVIVIVAHCSHFIFFFGFISNYEFQYMRACVCVRLLVLLFSYSKIWFFFV